jgi:hypothetical protein
MISRRTFQVRVNGSFPTSVIAVTNRNVPYFGNLCLRIHPRLRAFPSMQLRSTHSVTCESVSAGPAVKVPYDVGCILCLQMHEITGPSSGQVES